MLLAQNPPSIHSAMGRFWLMVRQHTAFTEHFSPCPQRRPFNNSPHSSSLYSTPLPLSAPLLEENEEEKRMEGVFGIEAARELQKQLVLFFHDYSFAVEAWGLLIG